MEFCMKTVLYCILLLLPVLGFSKTLVISDIDDTIKISHIRNTWDMLRTGISSRPNFKGMSQLYRLISQELKDSSFYYVTNTPKLIKWPHRKFIARHHYPQGKILFRGKDSSQMNKLNRFKEILSEQSPDRVIFFGDNGEYDSFAFHEIQKVYPDIEMLIFVRIAYPMNGLDDGGIYEGQSGFITAAEPALLLLDRGILSTQGVSKLVKKVTQGVTEESSYNSVTRSWYQPSWVNCRGHQFYSPIAVGGARMLEGYIEQRCQ